MTVPRVSVILPAARMQEQAQEIVDRLRTNKFVADIVVASPNFEVINARCFNDGGAGSSRALSQAYELTDGRSDYVAWLSEICLPEPGALDRMAALVSGRSAPFIAEFRTHPPVTPGHYRVCTITGHQYARWGMVSRETIGRVGGFFDSAYVAHYGDVDLSLRCWQAGGEVATCVDAVIEMRGHWHVSTAPASRDEAVFLDRWQKVYPAIVTRHTSEWNIDKEIPV
jgi:hypothetical protein